VVRFNPRLLRCVIVIFAIIAAFIPIVSPRPAAAAKPPKDIVVPAPYYQQGGTGYNATTNCGMAVVAAALAFAQVAYPTVADVRYTVGHNGMTNIGEWAWLLDVYGAKYENVWSQEDIDASLKAGKVVIVAAWMGNISIAWDYDQAWSPNFGQSGRYYDYYAGHALLIVGKTEDGANYLVHDPNVFPDRPSDYYGDGMPKGEYRRYSAAELWWSIATYAGGRALAVDPPPPPPPPPPPKRMAPKEIRSLRGPGGGLPTTRDAGEHLVEPPRVELNPHSEIYQPQQGIDEFSDFRRPRPRY
jgi:hypothetical protein